MAGSFARGLGPARRRSGKRCGCSGKTAAPGGLQTEGAGLQRLLTALEPDKTENAAEDYQRFFALARRYTHIEKLDRETLSLFVERIEVGPKELPAGIQKTVHREQPFRQSIRIFYRFIGELDVMPVRSFPLQSEMDVDVSNKNDAEENVENVAV